MSRTIGWIGAGLITLVGVSPSLAALTIISSSRSVTGQAQTGSSLQGNTSPTYTDPGAFDYDTGSLHASAPFSSGGIPVTTTADTRATLTSSFDPTGFSFTGDVNETSDGRAGQPASTSAEIIGNVTFTVDEPTPFTFTGKYSNTGALFGLGGHRLKVTMLPFINFSRVNTDQSFGPITATGVLQPGTTYTLETDVYGVTNDTSTVTPGITGLHLEYTMVIPEPGIVMWVLGLAAAGFRPARRAVRLVG